MTRALRTESALPLGVHSRSRRRRGGWMETQMFGRACAEAAMNGLRWLVARRKARLGLGMLIRYVALPQLIIAIRYHAEANMKQCHTHPKIKDAPKRRRESSSTRALAASTMAKPQTEPLKTEAPLTPQMTPRPVTSDNTTPAPSRTMATPRPNHANMI